MKILFSSHVFAPSIGGIETMSWLLAREWARLGHQIVLITQTPARDESIAESLGALNIKLVRQPSRRELWHWVKWCEVFFHNNLSLQTAWPLLLQRKPWVIAHHTYISRPDGTSGWQDRLKRSLLPRAHNITISPIIAEQLGIRSTVIANCYRDDTFFPRDHIAREKELIFLGRLVSDKGADTLLEALYLLGTRGLRPNLTLVGDGPEKDALKELAKKRELESQIEWAGAIVDEELASLLCEHKIIVIPSRWREPFGLVALEGMACGCVPIGSRDGGLKEAIGPCGSLFQNADAEDLADKIEALLRAPHQLEDFRAKIPAHLEQFSPSQVAQKYLQVLEQAN